VCGTEESQARIRAEAEASENVREVRAWEAEPCRDSQPNDATLLALSQRTRDAVRRRGEASAELLPDLTPDRSHRSGAPETEEVPMGADSLVIITVKGSDDRTAATAVYHRSIPEVRAEADTLESALDRLARRLVPGLDYISDDYHRDLVRVALSDIERARSGR
jgi:hypothetical protein